MDNYVRNAIRFRAVESIGKRCRLLLCWLLLAAIGGAARGQDATNELPSYSRSPVFYIPFQPDTGDRRLKQIQLYVSNDQGRAWHPYASVRPDETRFTFNASKDGLYWFSVRTVDVDNRAFPLTMDNARPGLKVIVDTQAPQVHVRGVQPRDGFSGVEWEIQDENIDSGSVTLEYRAQGSTEWVPLRVESAATGRHTWRPTTSGTLEVVLRCRDRAGNDGSARTTVLASPDNRVPAEAVQRQTQPVANAAPAIRMVNSKRVCLNYELKDVGPSGISVVELWYTQDGRSWQKYSEEKNHQPPYCFDVSDEGLYGFSLLVRSGVGLGPQPPQAGEQPQIWVEVDLTKPNVRLQNVEVGKGTETGNLTVTWVAADKNISRQPITISYAEQPAGPWTQVAANHENTGSYLWRMPQGVPYKFFVKVEAADRAGNIGEAVTSKSVIVDLSQPKVVITNVEPGKSNDPGKKDADQGKN